MPLFIFFGLSLEKSGKIRYTNVILNKENDKTMKIAFFDTKEYDRTSFGQYEKEGDIEFKFLDTRI